jgi:hypothetical protein
MGLFKNVPLQINEPPDDEQQSEYYVNADRFAEGTRVLFTIDKLSLPIISSESSKAAARRKRRIQIDLCVCDLV